jgi:hypothetical protein
MPSAMQAVWIAQPTATELTVVFAEWEKTPPITKTIQTNPKRSMITPAIPHSFFMLHLPSIRS